MWVLFHSSIATIDIQGRNYLIEPFSVAHITKFCPCIFWCIRLSYNLDSTDCAGALFYAMMKLAVDTPHGSPGKFPHFLVNIFCVCDTFFLSVNIDKTKMLM